MASKIGNISKFSKEPVIFRNWTVDGIPQDLKTTSKKSNLHISISQSHFEKNSLP